MRTEDGYLIRKCLDGESAAFGLLIDKYKAGIYALAYYNLQNFHDAEDIAQEVFIKAYENLHKLKNYDSFLAWLYSITSNLCKNFIRDKSKRPDGEFIADQTLAEMEISSIDHYQEFLNNEKLDEIDEAIHKALNFLPAAYRQVLTLYYLGDMDCIQIAKFIGKSPTAIRKQLDRARNALKNETISLISSSFEQQKAQRLQVTFTFRIVEAIKHIKIHPTVQTKNLPWGISLATSVIIAAILSFTSHQNLNNPIEISSGYPLMSKTKALKYGQIPVDILDESIITALSSAKKDANTEVKITSPREESLQDDHKSKGKWTRKADMPTRKHGSAGCSLNGKIYVIGGGTNPLNPPVKWYEYLPTMEEYDPATDKWTSKAAMSKPRMYFSAVVLNSKIYAIGGSNGLDKAYPTVEEYDPAINMWTKKSDMPTARAGFCTIAVNNKILAMGGINESWKALSTVEEYDPVTDTWIKKPDMPVPRHAFSVSEVNGKFYFFGGQTGSFQMGGPVLSLVEEYDPETEIWKKKADMPTARGGLSTCAVNGKIYAIGGMVEGTQMVPIVELYDPSTDTWSRVADMSEKKISMAVGVVDGKIYVSGGSTTFPFVSLPILEEYTPEDERHWSE